VNQAAQFLNPSIEYHSGFSNEIILALIGSIYYLITPYIYIFYKTRPMTNNPPARILQVLAVCKPAPVNVAADVPLAVAFGRVVTSTFAPLGGSKMLETPAVPLPEPRGKSANVRWFEMLLNALEELPGVTFFEVVDELAVW